LVAACPARAATTTRVDCGQKKVTVLFWPHGHHEIPSLAFPQFLVPHLEVYKTASAFPDVNELGVVQADGGTAVSKSCKQAGRREAKRLAKGSKRTAKETALSCKSNKSARLELVGDPGKSGTLRIWYGSVLGVVAKMVPTGSTLGFDRGYCSPFAL
jgi:hypothetical protein